MSEWKEIIIGELGCTFTGLSGKTAKDFGKGKPFIPYMNIFTNSKIDPTFLEYVEIKKHERQSIVKKGDLFFTTSSETVEEVGMTSVLLDDIEECYLNSFCFGFRLYNFDDLLPEYVPYLFRGEEVRKNISLIGRGSTRYNLPKTELLNRLQLKLPPLPTQRKIARILSTADAVIEKTQAAIAKYKAIKQGMLHDLFTRGIDTQTGKLRPKYQDAPELYKPSKLGWIPKGWEDEPLELFTTQIGDGIHTTPKYSENTDYYFVNGNNLSQGHILIGETALCVNEEEYKKHFIELNDRTILYSINGTIGNIAFYKGEKIILGKSACYISCKKNVNLDYIYFFLQSFQVSKFYDNELTGSTIKNLSLASIRNTPITIPNDETEQDLIAGKILSISNKIESEETYLHKIRQIKAGLMADLLSGKKEVTIDEETTN
jgi:type I restriction enzyme, S subunit